MSTGNFVTSEATIQLPGVGKQVIDATLHYNAQSAVDSPVGVGWSFAYGTHTQFYADGAAAVFLGDGRTYLFEPDGEPVWAGRDDRPALPSSMDLAGLREAGY